MTKLTPDAVHAIARLSLFKPHELEDGKPPANAILVEGLIHKYGFHPERIAAAKPEIDALLAELPSQFQKTDGGGWTFLNAYLDKHGNHWGEHRDIEILVCLGIAAGSASWLMKDAADVLPGGMPYFEVHPGEATT